MAFSEKLAERIRKQLANNLNVDEKPMMGGLTFMVNDKMCVGIIKDEMMCRINPELHASSIEKTGCREMDFTGRPMKGYVMVNDSGMANQSDFDYWVNLALDFNKIAKSSKKKKSKV
jgi:TfoX/Sxy family transcriptional regulator of competence genes